MLLLTLTITLTFDLSTPKPYYWISEDHSLYQVWTLLIHSFLRYAAYISVKYALIDPATVTFDFSIVKTIPVTTSRIPRSFIPCTTLERFRIIRFWVMLQTDGLKHPTHADYNKHDCWVLTRFEYFFCLLIFLHWFMWPNDRVAL